MRIDGHTRLAAVVASPIKHSISPFIHNLAFEKTHVNGVYVAWEIPESDLAETVENIRRYNMFGINLSMPYKEKVIPFLDGLSPEAQLIGAVNTVVNRDGRLIGHNTDGFGFFASLKNFNPKDTHIMILGAGGAAKSIVTQAVLDGAKKVSIYVRPQSLVKAKENFRTLLDQTDCYLEFHDLTDADHFQKELRQTDLLVNAT
ncbi:MAG: shikimate dehydrogenase, partial [Streptococcus sp.]